MCDEKLKIENSMSFLNIQDPEKDVMRTEHFLVHWHRVENARLPQTTIDFNKKVTVLSGEFCVVVGFSPQGLKETVIRPERVDGTFAFCQQDINGYLIVGTDRYGISPIYYAGGSDWFVAGTNLNLVKKHLSQVRIDIIALKQLIDLGEILGQRTVIEGVSRLRQGECITADQTDWKVKTMWKIELADPLPITQYIEITESLLRESLMRIGQSTKNSLVCPLTGGDDSRRIAFACDCIGLKPMSYTQLIMRDDGFDVDAAIAKQIASTIGLQHKIISPPNPRELVRHTAEVMNLTNCETLQHYWAFSFAQAIPSGFVLLDGLAAGVLGNGHFIRRYKEYINCWDDIKKITNILSHNIHNASTKTAIEEELSLLPAHEARLNLFFLFNHTRRNIGSWQQIFRAFDQVVVAPFFNGYLFEQSLRLSLKDTLELSPHILAMQHYYPQALDIPSTRRVVPKRFQYDLKSIQRGYFRTLALTVKPHPLACELMGVRRPVADIFRFAKAAGIGFGWWRILKVLMLSLMIETIETNKEEVDVSIS